ncbi:hypothetical protein JAAARDRAFT_28056 [Jaapia argillacea MUCL 33604]|uniref:Tyrosine specific protein phosphatases domain-containing protein n=1 Tax=Jaapia argillacea MUCL 33604 TaxID=933084 RepID=A0A067QE68_9AGAM|nr:hypothetical protein JAAARDRAFT_28056 [Jaapia argillacea MUCL 33604]
MEFEPLDPVYVEERLSRPPFVRCSGVYNIRHLGGYVSNELGGETRPNFVFRSAELSGITEKGKEQLRALGITTVFDLRSDTEMEKYNSPIPNIEGVEVVRVPVFQKEDYSPEMMAKRFELYSSGKTEAFMELYSQILDNGGEAFGTILRHIRDRPSEACVVHCTAGKDRTGVVAAIVLKLAGVHDGTIAEEYALTRVGREPARKFVMARLAKVPFFAKNTEAALNMLTCRPETMTAFLSLLQDKYGGVEEYARSYARLSDGDIATIRRNLMLSS